MRANTSKPAGYDSPKQDVITSWIGQMELRKKNAPFIMERGLQVMRLQDL